MILQILFCLLIIIYWFSEGVTEGWTWSTKKRKETNKLIHPNNCLLYTSPSPRDVEESRMPSSA